jgi:hypothetical protein
MLKQGKLLYSSQKDRWEIHGIDDEPFSLHCGECFEIKVGETFLPCRIEIDRDWVLYFANTMFYLHPASGYSVRVV